MKVLFVSSGNSKFGIVAFIKSQGESLKRNGINLDYFPIVGKGINGYLKNIPILRRKLSKERYDVIHAHYGLCGIVSNLSRKNEKLVVSLMGDDLLGEVRKDGSYTKKSKFISYINKYFALSKFDYCIVKSENLKREIPNVNKIEIVPNGVDFNIFFPVDKGICRDKLKIEKSKIVILFPYNPSGSEKNYKNYPLAEKSVTCIDDNNIELKIVFGKTQEELNLYYNSSDLLLLTSFHEGSPNAVKEAMACNCPIVATDVGDVKKMIGFTEGCYITNGDLNNVCDKIKLAIKFGKRTNGRENIKHLEINLIAQKVTDIYKRVLQ